VFPQRHAQICVRVVGVGADQSVVVQAYGCLHAVFGEEFITVTPTAGERFYRHGLHRLSGRDVNEQHRVSTTLELFFDLAFAIAFGAAGAQFAQGIAAGHAGIATLAFIVAMIATVWAWTGYSWFASAFDNDDWLFRVLTLVQMAGVIVLAIGIPQLFTVVENGTALTGRVMVAGYVIMRVAVVAQWTRVMLTDGTYRRLALGNTLSVGGAQLGWVTLTFVNPGTGIGAIVAYGVLWVIDLGGPMVAASLAARRGAPLPWHPHHLAERYSLLAIIAIGETIAGTLAAAQMISGAQGWSVTTVLVTGIGIAMSFSLWWTYFLIPSAPILSVRRSKVIPWAVGHSVLFASIAAAGAGFRVIGYYYDHQYSVSTIIAVAAVALPVFTFLATVYASYVWLVNDVSFDIGDVVGFVAPIAAIGLASIGGPLWACLFVALASPVTLIVSYELGKWKSLAAQLDTALYKATTDRDPADEPPTRRPAG
jgi:low temperature requirement protein LtrA